MHILLEWKNTSFIYYFFILPIHILFERKRYPIDMLRLANRGRLLLRTPGPVPFGTCICSNVETILSWTCHIFGPFEFRTSLGTSILLWGENDTNSYTWRSEKYTPFQPHICLYLYNGSSPPGEVHVYVLFDWCITMMIRTSLFVLCICVFPLM